MTETKCGQNNSNNSNRNEVIAYTAAAYAMSDIAYTAAILYTNVAI